MVLIKATGESEADTLPSAELIQAMGDYNRELFDVDIVRGGEGLKPSSEGRRVVFDGYRRTVIDGPFPGPTELVAGFRLWEVEDIDEAVEWVKRSPNPMPGPSEIAIRPLFEVADFAEAMTTEQATEEERLRRELENWTFSSKGWLKGGPPLLEWHGLIQLPGVLTSRDDQRPVREGHLDTCGVKGLLDPQAQLAFGPPLNGGLGLGTHPYEDPGLTQRLNTLDLGRFSQLVSAPFRVIPHVLPGLADYVHGLA